MLAILYPMAVQFIAPEQGTYRIQVGIDNSEPYRIPMHVTDQLPPGMAPPPAG